MPLRWGQGEKAQLFYLGGTRQWWHPSPWNRISFLGLKKRVSLIIRYFQIKRRILCHVIDTQQYPCSAKYIPCVTELEIQKLHFPNCSASRVLFRCSRQKTLGWDFHGRRESAIIAAPLEVGGRLVERLGWGLQWLPDKCLWLASVRPARGTLCFPKSSRGSRKLSLPQPL